MIKLTSKLFKSFNNFKQTALAFNNNKAFFAKQAPKKGGKQQKKPQPVPVQQQASQKLQPYEKLINYFAPLQMGLSPSQTQYLNKNFNNIAEEQKEMLDKLADKIVELNTSVFYNFVYQRQGLGTSEAYFVGQGNFQEKQMSQAIKRLRKDL